MTDAGLIYLDHAAGTPVDPAVATAMDEVLRSPDGFANPAADHVAGRSAARRIEQARTQVAGLIGADAREIIWTSGATEADNLAIIGAARFRAGRGRHLVTSLVEHAAVLESFRALEADGFTVTYLRPGRNGVVDAAAVAAAITQETTLVSIMHANNEIGSVQDIAAIGAICRARGALFHVDAAQSAGRLPLDVRAMPIDLMSLSAHKIHGPKGIGALYMNAQHCRRVEPLLYGGGQQRGLRPGTLPTHQIVGMGLAFELARRRITADVPAIEQLRDRLWTRLSAVPGVLLNGSESSRICHILNVSVDGVEGESLRLALAGIAVSSGSACASASGEPSPVLRVLGRNAQLAEASLRFSPGRDTTGADIDAAADRFVAAVQRLRALAPDGMD